MRVQAAAPPQVRAEQNHFTFTFTTSVSFQIITDKKEMKSSGGDVHSVSHCTFYPICFVITIFTVDKDLHIKCSKI